MGPMATAAAEVDGGVVQQSAVKIQRCRYLAESGCTAMCVNLCKVPAWVPAGAHGGLGTRRRGRPALRGLGAQLRLRVQGVQVAELRSGPRCHAWGLHRVSSRMLLGAVVSGRDGLQQGARAHARTHGSTHADLSAGLAWECAPPKERSSRSASGAHGGAAACTGHDRSAPGPAPPSQAPTQTFFTEQLGMPLTMTPNFDDYSCEVGTAMRACTSPSVLSLTGCHGWAERRCRWAPWAPMLLPLAGWCLCGGGGGHECAAGRPARRPCSRTTGRRIVVLEHPFSLLQLSFIRTTAAPLSCRAAFCGWCVARERLLGEHPPIVAPGPSQHAPLLPLPASSPFLSCRWCLASGRRHSARTLWQRSPAWRPAPPLWLAAGAATSLTDSVSALCLFLRAYRDAYHGKLPAWGGT